MKHTYIFLIILGLTACSTKKENQKEDFCGILPTQSDFFVLIEPNTISITENHLFLDFAGNPYLIIDSLAFALFSDKNGTVLSVPFSLIPNEICCFSDGSMFILQDTSLIKIANNKKEYTIPLPYRQLQINKAGENGIYVCGLNMLNKKYDLYFIDKNKNTMIKIISDSIPVNTAVGTGSITMVAMDSIIYLLHDGKMQSLLKADEKITALTDNEAGIFFSTASSVGFFDEQYQPVMFYNKGALKLLSHSDTLYILDNDRRFSFITATNNFKTLTDTIN